MTYDKIKEICDKYGIYNWTLNSQTGLVDVDGGVDLYNENLTELPLNFGNVKGHFWCSGNNLTTLKGAPHSVGGYFNCRGNNLTSIEYFPKKIRGSVYCSNNSFKRFRLSNIDTFIDTLLFYVDMKRFLF